MANKTKKNEQRKHAKNVWHAKAPKWDFGQEEFKLVMPRGRGRAWNITPLVTDFGWDDVDAMMTGSVSLQYPDDRKLGIFEGDEIKCLLSRKGGKRFKELWSMRVREPNFDKGTGAFSASLEDDSSILNASREDWEFKKDNGHKDGWKAHQIAEYVCKKYGIKARLAKGHYPIPKLVKTNASPLSIINEAYKQERERTGRTYVTYWHQGRLVIRPLKRNRYLAKLGPALTAAAIAQKRNKAFATALTVRGSRTVKKGDDDPAEPGEKGKNKDKGTKEKMEVTVESKPLIRRYGRIHRFLERENELSKHDMRDLAKRQFRDKAVPKMTASVDSPGIPFIRRGHAVRLALGGVPGLRSEIVFVTEAYHSVSSAGYDMSLTLNFTDPYADAEKERECVQKCIKAQEKGHDPPKDCDCPAWIKNDSKKKKETEKSKQRGGSRR